MLQLIEIFINVVMPVFTLVLIGYYAGPKLKLEARPLSRFAYFVLVPAFTFNIISAAQVQVELAARMIIYIIVVYTSSALLGLLIAWLLGRPAKMIGAYVLLAVFGNVGNFGLPLIEFRLGKEALLAATLYFLAASTVAFAIGVAAANWNNGKKLAALSEVAKTPALLAMLPAFFFNWAEIEPPLFLGRVINLLAAAMIPIMLIVLGVQLAGVGRPRFSRDVWVASAVRLVGGPILGFLWVIPFGLTGIERGAGIFQAAMPAAVLASIIALEYDLLPDFVTTTVLFSTLASIITLTIVLAVV